MRRAVVVAQRRSRSGERTAIRIFASRCEAFDIELGRPRRRVELRADDPIF